MRQLLDQTVFRVTGERYSWADVVLAAMRRGEWGALEDLARQGLLASRHADAAGVRLPPESLDAAARAFRYARNLLSGLDAETWLARWRLDLGDWEASLRRTLLREQLALPPPAGGADEPDAGALAAALHADGACSGMLERFALELARRVAAQARLRGSDPTPSAEPPPDGASAVAAELAVARHIDRGVRELGAVPWRARLAALAAADAAHERLREHLLTPAAIRDQIRARRLDYVRFSCRLISVREKGVAGEAALGLRADGRRVTTLAGDVRVVPLERRVFLDELDASVRDRFLAAGTGDVLGPLSLGDEWHIVVIREKRLPSDDDPDVRRRASDDLFAETVAREVDRHVRWEFRL